MEEKIEQILKEYSTRINYARGLKELDYIFLELFGKKGKLDLLPKEFAKLSDEQRRRVGPLFNKVKEELEKAVNDKREEVREEGYKKLETETLDLKEIASPLAPSDKKRTGHLHPTTQFTQEIVKLFEKIGFAQFDAPQIDTDYNNFEVLNIPPQHPARDLWDTLYISSKLKARLPDGQVKSEKLLLRTHTSNSQIHIMKAFKPPIRMMVLGRCFRYENLDPRHEHTFDQFELVYIDKGLSMANLQYLSEYFLHSVLGKDTEVRLRPKYYPFTEPSMGFDGVCPFCKGRGCKICADTGWIELGGGGMIHPKVLKNGGINPNVYTGIAWGPGLQRIMMLKWGIEDIRLFLKGDLRFLGRF